MKKIILLLLVIVTLIGGFALSSCEDAQAPVVNGASLDSEGNLVIEYDDGSTKNLGKLDGMPKSIERVYVNEEKHAIAEYSDGTTQDLGYVGVNVIPPLYTVTFVDMHGNPISTQKIYEGQAATAPTAPDEADRIFKGWNKSFDNVQSNLTVQAVYDNAAEYTVIFKDELGNTLKTETVISGHSATAPDAPSREDTIFTGWDKSFTNITSDITVTAQYRTKNDYTVTFKDYSGRVLGTQSVKEGSNASAPIIPSREGYTFTGWSSSLNGVTSNKAVTAQYSLNSGNNIFDISYTLGNNNTVTVSVALKGTVRFCGVQGSIGIPLGLTYQSLTAGNGVTANYTDGSIIFVYTSNSGHDITSATTILTITFAYSQSFTSADLGLTVEDIYDEQYTPVTYTVIGKKITVK